MKQYNNHILHTWHYAAKQAMVYSEIYHGYALTNKQRAMIKERMDFWIKLRNSCYIQGIQYGY